MHFIYFIQHISINIRKEKLNKCTRTYFLTILLLQINAKLKKRNFNSMYCYVLYKQWNAIIFCRIYFLPGIKWIA